MNNGKPMHKKSATYHINIQPLKKVEFQLNQQQVRRKQNSPLNTRRGSQPTPAHYGNSERAESQDQFDPEPTNQTQKDIGTRSEQSNDCQNKELKRLKIKILSNKQEVSNEIHKVKQTAHKPPHQEQAYYNYCFLLMKLQGSTISHIEYMKHVYQEVEQMDQRKLTRQIMSLIQQKKYFIDDLEQLYNSLSKTPKSKNKELSILYDFTILVLMYLMELNRPRESEPRQEEEDSMGLEFEDECKQIQVVQGRVKKVNLRTNNGQQKKEPEQVYFQLNKQNPDRSSLKKVGVSNSESNSSFFSSIRSELLPQSFLSGKDVTTVLIQNVDDMPSLSTALQQIIKDEHEDQRRMTGLNSALQNTRIEKVITQPRQKVLQNDPEPKAVDLTVSFNMSVEIPEEPTEKSQIKYKPLFIKEKLMQSCSSRALHKDQQTKQSCDYSETGTNRLPNPHFDQSSSILSFKSSTNNDTSFSNQSVPSKNFHSANKHKEHRRKLSKLGMKNLSDKDVNVYNVMTSYYKKPKIIPYCTDTSFTNENDGENNHYESGQQSPCSANPLENGGFQKLLAERIQSEPRRGSLNQQELEDIKQAFKEKEQQEERAFAASAEDSSDVYGLLSKVAVRPVKTAKINLNEKVGTLSAILEDSQEAGLYSVIQQNNPGAESRHGSKVESNLPQLHPIDDDSDSDEEQTPRRKQLI